MAGFFSKKRNIVLIVVLSVLAFLVITIFPYSIGRYNKFVELQQTVEEKQSSISVQLKRRADLIPNFAKTATAYSNYEQETFIAVTNARAAVKNADTVEEQTAAAAQLDAAIDVWVNAVTEAYPDIKSDELYRALQDELAGTENRIAKARKDYNDAVKEYNSKVKRFPSNLLAGIFGFEEAEYFEIDEADTKVPELSFD